MRCPACELMLIPREVEEIKVDVCEGSCGGIWFDAFELDKLDEPHESAGEALLDLETRSGLVLDREKERSCPRCNVPLMQHFYSVKRQVEVDECPQCAGIWLDDGELASIRSQYDTEEERRQAAHEYFEDIFGLELKALKSDSEADRAKAQKIAHIFRFICPSYYLPGKQSWGAF